MLVVTWNVNSLRARLGRVLEFLALHEPDVLCLQETKCSEDNFPVQELTDAGYDATHHSGGQWAGVALLSRHGVELADPTLGLDGEPSPTETRWIEATVAAGADVAPLRVVSTYVPNGRTLDSPEYPRKLTFLDAAARRAGALSTDEAPLLICGDFNIAPADADVYDPELFVGGTHVTDDERSRLTAIESAGRLRDAYRELHPDEPQFTWWDYRAGNFHKGKGLRIDLALISESLAPALAEVRIDRDFRKGLKPSDHAPLMVRFG